DLRLDIPALLGRVAQIDKQLRRPRELLRLLCTWRRRGIWGQIQLGQRRPRRLVGRSQAHRLLEVLRRGGEIAELVLFDQAKREQQLSATLSAGSRFSLCLVESRHHWPITE